MDASWDDDVLVAYVVGGLSDHDRRRVEAMAREDETLDATLAVMGALLGDAELEQEEARPSPDISSASFCSTNKRSLAGCWLSSRFIAVLAAPSP